MTLPVLATKFYLPPAGGKLVDRPRLTQQLTSCLQDGARLALVVAPAGFGKSTLVASCLQNQPHPFSWLSLDEGDNDPTRFFTYLVAALQKINPQMGVNAMERLRQPGADGLLAAANLLVNEIAEYENLFMLALDDLHVITNPAIVNLINFLVDHQPQMMRLVLISREDPALPLSRLRVRRQVVEIRQTDLRFNPREAADFLNLIMGLDLAAGEIEALEQRTEGWIAGLQLAALSMQTSPDRKSFLDSFAGSDRYILDYLLEEVVSRQPADVQTFLLKTSVLPRMNAQLCQILVAEDISRPAGEFLESLERSGLFLISLDNQRIWYRYHHLFGELLQHRLVASHGAAACQELRRRAANWFMEQGFLAEAIEHALAAREYRTAALWIGRNGQPVLFQGEVGTMLVWLKALPEEVVQSQPDLWLIFAWAYTLTGQHALALNYLSRADEILLPGPGQFEPDPMINYLGGSTGQIQDMQAEASILRAMIYRDTGKGDLARELAEKALKLANPENYFIQGLSYQILAGLHRIAGNVDEAVNALEHGVSLSLKAGNLSAASAGASTWVRMLLALGNLNRAEEVCQKLLEDFHKENAPIALKMLEISLARVHIERCELQKAEALLLPALNELLKSGYRELLLEAKLLQVRIYFFRGNLLEATALMKKLQGTSPIVDNDLAAGLARVAIRAGDLAAAHQWAIGSGLIVLDAADRAREFEQLTLVRLLLADARLYKQPELIDQALEFLQRLAENAKNGNRNGSLIECSVLAAQFNILIERRKVAFEMFNLAIALAAPHGLVSYFVYEGQPVHELLVLWMQENQRDYIHKDFLIRILAAFSSLDPATASTPERTMQVGLIEPLSDRELEVLRLIADGMSNPEIAQKLFLSTNTLKAHTQNIYMKLDVHSRVQAINRANELGLI